jgi:hypothetical protein
MQQPSPAHGHDAPAQVRTRFWVEAAFAATSTLLLLMTVVWPDWIELVFGADPDHGDGSVEWLIAVLALLISATFSALARAEWRRTRVATSG